MESLGVLILILASKATFGVLYPFDSETRDVRSLCEIPWKFYKSPPADPAEGLRLKFNETGVPSSILMPVPSSYNDVTTDGALRDHVGVVWYERSFRVPSSWNSQRVWVYFGSVSYSAIVWINGHEVVRHDIGHLPFLAEITQWLKFGIDNRISVYCDNRLTNVTVPQGRTNTMQLERKTQSFQSYTFDFFNYAGIHRDVKLYTTPFIYIDDIDVSASLAGENGVLSFNVTVAKLLENITVDVSVYDKQGVKTGGVTDSSLVGNVVVPNVQRWWPIFMNNVTAYLYQVEFVLKQNNKPVDVYRRNVGFRTLQWSSNSFRINEKPIYLRGVGKHEDFYIKGRGFDWAVVIKDFNLMKWLGVNSFRTSHYPFHEETIQLAEQLGFMVISESSSVNTVDFGLELLANHRQAVQELIQRDKQYACVIMWSLANEAKTENVLADPYFSNLATLARSLDSSRPISAALATDPYYDQIAKYLDVIMFNRYNAWYINPGILETIYDYTYNEIYDWYRQFKKPVILAEYGADNYEGLHMQPSFIWSEEFAQELYSQHFRVFDDVRGGFFVGEMIWNLADFQTAEQYIRVGGNKKGILTRSRQPKGAAPLIRKRYTRLARELDGYPLPSDVSLYYYS